MKKFNSQADLDLIKYKYVNEGKSYRQIAKELKTTKYIIQTRIHEMGISPHPKAKDITNQRFGKLIAIEPTKNKKEGSIIWKCKCDCGNTTYVSVSELNRTNNNTQSCGCYQREQIRKIGIKNGTNLLNKKFGKLTVIEKTNRRMGRTIIWKCKCDCGNICYVSTNNLKSGHSTSCGCIKSKGEQAIAKYLKAKNISFIKEYRFKDCKNKISLPFDFYLPDYNCCIEYDGEQHFHVAGWSNEEKLKDIQYRDAIKTNYCAVNNINLIRIKYTDFNKIEDILNIALQKIKE